MLTTDRALFGLFPCAINSEKFTSQERPLLLSPLDRCVGGPSRAAHLANDKAPGSIQHGPSGVSWALDLWPDSTPCPRGVYKTACAVPQVSCRTGSDAGETLPLASMCAP